MHLQEGEKNKRDCAQWRRFYFFISENSSNISITEIHVAHSALIFKMSNHISMVTVVISVAWACWLNGHIVLVKTWTRSQLKANCLPLTWISTLSQARFFNRSQPAQLECLYLDKNTFCPKITHAEAPPEIPVSSSTGALLKLAKGVRPFLAACGVCPLHSTTPWPFQAFWIAAGNQLVAT